MLTNTTLHDVRLADTASMVLAWSLPFFQEEPCSRFLEHLDLSAGASLKRECDAITPLYPEIMQNRKQCMVRVTEAFLGQVGQNCQVLIPAAGWSPLSLILLSRFSRQIKTIIEFDVTPAMATKKEIYDSVAEEYSNQIQCIEADLSDPFLVDQIQDEARWRPGIPTLILLEGITYYLSPGILRHVLSSFVSNDHVNRVAMEYLPAEEEIAHQWRSIPRDTFAAIQAYCGYADTTRYTSSDITDLVRSAGGCPEIIFTMSDMEAMRLGNHRYFSEPASGWIQCLWACL